MKNILRYFSLVILCSLGLVAQAQGPSCVGLNVPLDMDGNATLTVGHFVPNIDAAGPVDVEIQNPYGGVIESVAGAGEMTEIVISACGYLGRELMFVASNSEGTCMKEITFKQGNGPVIEGRSDTVYCDDPLLVSGALIDGTAPTAMVPCIGTVDAEFVADWIEVFDCVNGENLAKIIYREFEAYDKAGVRATNADTIYVFRLPEVSEDNVYCVEKDTTYCGIGNGEPFGPYMVVDDLTPTDEEIMNADACDTIYFIGPDGLGTALDPKCGLSVAVDVEDFGGDCASTYKYTVSIKQSCFGAPGACTVTPPAGSGLEEVAEGYYVCTFWLIDLDTVPPVVECDLSHGSNFDGDTLIVPTGTHDCYANIGVPPVYATDTACNDVVAVKAMIEGIGTIPLEFDGEQWVSTKIIKLPLHEQAVAVVYEAYDDCHNYGYDTCYIRVKDLTKPVAVADKGINVSLTDKKIWVDAETFDEGSYDNCGVNMLLARRSDWQTACVDLCDSLIYDYIDGTDTLWLPYLSDDQLSEPIEAHYKKVIEWFGFDGQECSELLYYAWKYALYHYGTVVCKGVDQETFDHLIHYSLGELPDDVILIGGGWATEVPFSCEDACQAVTVEILVMDYWCNWSKAWTDVWVEDKTPVDIVKDVATEFDITCKAYREDVYTFNGVPASIEEIVEAAGEGDEDAYAALDAIFGGYQKAWINPYGDYVDAAGEEIVCDFYFYDSDCECYTAYRLDTIPDEHFGEVIEEVPYRYCEYLPDSFELNHGIIAVNCAENVHCDQDVWYDFDHCGQGVIYRKFKIYQGCPTTDSPHIPDTIVRIQEIWVGNNCELDLGMFTLPDHVEVESCGIEYDADGSGNVGGALSPDSIGRPTYTFDDDCRIVGVGYYDKVFEIVGGDGACFKVLRTWCFADWCETEKPFGDAWLKDLDEEDGVLKYVQKIIVNDTTPPVVSIAPVTANDTINAGGCMVNLSTTASVEDACGVLSYRWTLSDDEGTIVDLGQGELDGLADNFAIESPDLGTGEFTIRVIVTDQCQNEGVAVYTFFVSTNKKPSPVCITDLTVELTPMDLNNDGVIDTGMAVIWAAEYAAPGSSIPACDDDSLAYFIEFVDGIGDDTLDPEDADSLAIGCEHFTGAKTVVRLWVQSFPSGTYDYCDVLLTVQNNMSACGDISSAQGVAGTILTELEEKVEQVNVIAQTSDGQQLSSVTTSTGFYNFSSAQGVDVTVTPVKDTDHMNGISTADLIKIQKHILRKVDLDNELREIAADVNNDQKISALDLLDLRKLILAKIDELPNSDSWRFVNNVNGKASYTVENIEQLMAIDFTGIKVGDVNIDNDPSRSARSKHDLTLNVDDMVMKTGNRYEVAVRAENFNDIEGYQFTINFDATALELADITYTGALDLTADNFSLQRANEGVITTSYSSADAKALSSDEVLFTLVFAAKAETQLSNAFTVNSRVTNAEAYNSSNELLGVSVNFGDQVVSGQEFALYQNRPNPFKETTTIGFNLPSASAASLTIYDVTGRVLKVVDGDFTKGYNEIAIKKSDVNATGVLYYQLDSEEYTATKRMIVIE